MAFLPPGETLAAEILDLSWPFNKQTIEMAYRAAALATHPDHGGNPRFFRACTLAKELLLGFLVMRSLPPPSQRREGGIPRGWRRSQKGNLWRKYRNVICTVFSANEGYKWVYDGTFSGAYDSEEEACWAAEEELG